MLAHDNVVSRCKSLQVVAKLVHKGEWKGQWALGLWHRARGCVVVGGGGFEGFVARVCRSTQPAVGSAPDSKPKEAQ